MMDTIKAKIRGLDNSDLAIATMLAGLLQNWCCATGPSFD